MRYEIITDEGPMHPRKDQDSFGTILYTSYRYELGDERVDGEEIERKLKDPSVIALPVYAMIHGSVQLNTTGFSCKFDSGQCGCIYITKEEVRKIWNIKRINSAKYVSVQEMLTAEIKIYSQYLAGEVYGYRIFDDQDEEIESCWGFYGMETAEKEAKEAVKAREYFLNLIKDCVDENYIPPSSKALAALDAGIQSAKNEPIVFRSENFTQHV